MLEVIALNLIPGLTKGFISQLVNEVFHPEYGLFQLSSNRVSIQPNPLGVFVSDYQTHYRFLGRYVAKALLENWYLLINFTKSFLKHILSK